MLNVIIIGCGKFGRKRALSCLSQNNHFNLAGLFDANPQKALALASEVDSIQINDLDVFLLNSRIDLAIIATPNNSHLAYCEKLLPLGINILCEKPIVQNIRELEKLRSLALKSKSVLKMGTNLRFFPATLYIKNILEELGKIIKVKAQIGHDGTMIRNTWHEERNISGGGTLIDNGIHLLDLFQSYFGGLTQLNLRLEKDNRGVEYEAKGHASFIGCSHVELLSSWKSQADYCTFEVYGEKGTIQCNVVKDEVLLTKNSRTERIQLDLSYSSLDAELLFMKEMIGNRIPFFPSMGELQSMFTLIEEVYGREFSVTQI